VAVSLVHAVEVPRLPVSRLEPVIGAPRHAELARAAGQVRQVLAGRTIWNVNSTAAGGGVAEMLQFLVGYVQDLDIAIGWLVITGDAGFFAITKRLHNQIHGSMSGAPLSAAQAAHYAQMLSANAVELAARVRPGDVVLLHDPQTAGLAAPLAQAGARVVWRCHIGVDWENEATRAGWDFLRPHLAAAEAYVFSRRQYVPSWVPAEKTWIIPPSIDPFSPKNQQLDAETVRAILVRLGVLDGATTAAPARFTRRTGDVDTVIRSASVIGEGRPGPGDPVLVQVSRWDRLKHMAGVMRGFADYVAPAGGGYLMLVGPAVTDVSDDPEGAAVYGECLLQWHDLSPAARARILLVTLPLDDVDENAAMVNALQRHATVVVQKSLAEGFGLTVSEGMWKGRPVIGSAVGGIIDQIAEGTGILLPDPGDLAAFGSAAGLLLGDQDRAARMGQAAHVHVRENFIGNVHLLRYGRLLGSLTGGG
jgi:trehalose synthase